MKGMEGRMRVPVQERTGISMWEEGKSNVVSALIVQYSFSVYTNSPIHLRLMLDKSQYSLFIPFPIPKAIPETIRYKEKSPRREMKEKRVCCGRPCGSYTSFLPDESSN